VIVRNGKDGSPFLQVGDGESKKYANVPEDLAPADLTIEMAMELFNQKTAATESAGIDPKTGRQLLVKNRQGFYLEVEGTPEEIEAKVRPTWISVPPGVDPRNLPQEELNLLCAMPISVGIHPDTGKPILFKIGKFGPYIESGEDRRTVEDWKSADTLTVEKALEIFAQPRFGAKRAAAAALKEFGELPGAAGPVKVMSGRYGPYITDGETNATLPKGTNPEELTAETATALLAAKREAGPSTRPKFKRAVKKAAPKAKAKPKAKKS
jgi:DNA topoisomerase-1